MIDSLVTETIEEIESDRREDGLKLPLQAERAARQVVGRYDLRSPGFVEILMNDAIAYETCNQVIGDWYKFARTSLVDFIGEAAKQQMGDEYPRLLHKRLEALAPSSPSGLG